MWAILLFFAVGVVITIERLIFLFGTAQINPEQLMAKIASLIRKGSIEGAIASVSEEKAPLARIIEAALRNYKGTERDIQNAVDEMALAELPRINARIGYLAMLANVSTMVGLLGTIFGLIAAFAAVAAADPEQKSVLLANGISQAMNTTAFGLISAIPLLIVHSVLTSKSDTLVDDIDRYSVMVMNDAGTGEKGSLMAKAASGRSRTGKHLPEIDLLPVMNLFCCIIPFLLFSATFLEVVVIEMTQTEGVSNAGAGATANLMRSEEDRLQPKIIMTEQEMFIGTASGSVHVATLWNSRGTVKPSLPFPGTRYPMKNNRSI